MICLEAKYFTLNKILLQAVGLWPFDQSKLITLQFSILFSIVISALVCQLTTFVNAEYPSEIIFGISGTAISTALLILHYGAIRVNVETIKNLMVELHRVCKELKDENEIAIIVKYGYGGRRLSIICLVIILGLLFIFVISQISPNIFNIILSINGSQRHRLQIMAEYFLDQEKYFYLIILHMDIGIFIGLIALIAALSMFITYLQHTCGMFTIASYRIEHAAQVNVFQNVGLKIERLIFQRITDAITIHRQAMTLSEVLISRFDRTYFCLTTVAVITLSLNVFETFQVIESENITETIRPTMIVCFITLYMFIATYMGQSVTDHCNRIYVAAYNIEWYMYSLHIQKLILFLLQRAVKEFYLTCGGLFVASLECFAMLIKASMSYFLFIHSAV